MDTAKVDVRKLQLLNDRINQCIDALQQVRVSVHGLSHTSGIAPGVQGGMMNPYMMQNPLISQLYPYLQQQQGGMNPFFGQGLSHTSPFGQNPWSTGVNPMQNVNPFQVNPFTFNPFTVSPFQANPLIWPQIYGQGLSHSTYGQNPLFTNPAILPYLTNPLLSPLAQLQNPLFQGGGQFQGSPFQGSPFQGSPFQGQQGISHSSAGMGVPFSPINPSQHIPTPFANIPNIPFEGINRFPFTSGISHTTAPDFLNEIYARPDIYARPLWADPFMAARVAHTFPYINLPVAPGVGNY